MRSRKAAKAALAALRAFGYEVTYLVPPMPATEDGAGDRSVAPHWRRAHWRRQRYGAGRERVRLIRIPAVLVRKDRGEPEMGRIYTTAADI